MGEEVTMVTRVMTERFKVEFRRRTDGLFGL
jgi:hypothetical protein